MKDYLQEALIGPTVEISGRSTQEKPPRPPDKNKK